LVPSKEEYFITSSEYGSPQTSYKAPSTYSDSNNDSPGVLADMSKFVRTNVDKGIKAIKDFPTKLVGLVTPSKKPSTGYGVPIASPITYSYGTF
jgi:hypothetical protein